MLIMLLFSYKPYDNLHSLFFILNQIYFHSNRQRAGTCMHIYENINKCRYRVRGTGTIHIREKYMRKEYKC